MYLNNIARKSGCRLHYLRQSGGGGRKEGGGGLYRTGEEARSSTYL